LKIVSFIRDFQGNYPIEDSFLYRIYASNDHTSKPSPHPIFIVKLTGFFFIIMKSIGSFNIIQVFNRISSLIPFY
jgi:hypothetical protein